jgi:hypothetical protein
MLAAIQHDEGEADGSQAHRAYFPDRVEFRAFPLTPVIDTEITASADVPQSVSARRRPSTQAARSNKIASACTIYVSAPASAPTSMSCTVFCVRLA